MKIMKPLFISAALLLSLTSFADDKHEEGEKLFKTLCIACHGVAVGGMDMSKRIAPPIAGVRKHYLDVYPDEAAFIGAISSWVENQDESKSLMPGAVRKFKIMPPISVSKEDSAKIAAYIFSGNIEKPEGLNKHMDQMHKKMAMMDQHNGHSDANHNQMGQTMVGLKVMPNNGMGGNRGAKGMMRQLNLSPQQKQKMQGLIQAKKAIMQPLRKELKQIKQAIHRLDTTSSEYKTQIFVLADKKAKLIFRMVIEKGEKRMNIEAVLNPQQRAKFAEIRQRRFMHKKNH